MINIAEKFDAKMLPYYESLPDGTAISDPMDTWFLCVQCVQSDNELCTKCLHGERGAFIRRTSPDEKVKVDSIPIKIHNVPVMPLERI